MEKYEKGTIADVSWRDMLAQDPYYGLSNSFQYSENINCDDELHGIKLSQRIMKKNDEDYARCQLVNAGDRVFMIPQGRTGDILYFEKNTGPNTEDHLNTSRFPAKTPIDSGHDIATGTLAGESVVFQDCIWASCYSSTYSGFVKFNIKTLTGATVTFLYDHAEDSDESISDINTKLGIMGTGINQVLNFNNTRLVCGVGQDLWVYYPELDKTGTSQYDKSTGQTRTVTFGETGWKKVQHFENGCVIVGLTCDFEYLKVWVTDEGWNTKMYYYPGNNDLRNTFVYNLIDMSDTKVLRVYNINGIDYFTASLDGTDGYITFNKVIGDTPVKIFTQRGGLTQYDVNQKAGYFVGPTSIDAGYEDGSFYVADAYGVFKFAYNPTGYDAGYLKWKVRTSPQHTDGLCVAWNFLFISDEQGLKAMRLYDTGVDGYESKGILISREMEGDYGGCVAKILDEIRCHYELNDLKNASGNYIVAEGETGTIDVYVSPNNRWQNVDPETDSKGWYKVMSITGENRETRFEKINALNSTQGTNADPSFEFDRQTITYCVVIKRGKTTAQWTPVVREINMTYNLKGKTNNIYGLRNS